jgi:hypothetical protein
MQADDSSILTSRRHRVVIAGAGLPVRGEALRRGGVDMTVIDRRFAQGLILGPTRALGARPIRASPAA